MRSLDKLLRPNILGLSGYVCARDEFEGVGEVFLDANESPWENGVNRYPDPRQRALRERVAELRGVDAGRVMLGNGSDEVIDLLIRATCRPGVDSVVTFVPGYGMYEVSAAVNDAGVVRLGLTDDLLPDVDALRGVRGAKLAFVCSPNNPVGRSVPQSVLRDICAAFEGLVVVDEAYVDFSEVPSAVALLDELDNLFVLQTLSKAWGMAGLRIGIGIGAPELIAVLDKVKTPYNIGSAAQQAAMAYLADVEGFRSHVATTIAERERLRTEFDRLGIFPKIYPSDTNFLLVSTPRFRELYTFLAHAGIIVRLRDIPPIAPQCLRITIGTPAENNKLLGTLKKFKL